jgi:hypothetical protein
MKRPMRSLAPVSRLASSVLAAFGKPDVYVVFLEFTPAHRESGMRVLAPFVGRLFPGHRVRYVVVDNAYERDERVPAAAGADVIAGDNSSREFSGLDKGIEHVKRTYRPRPRSIFVLANDTFHRSYGSEYLAGFDPVKVKFALRANRAVGYVDCYPNEIQVLGLPVRCWIRTSLVILTCSTIATLGKLAIPVANERIFGGVADFFRGDAPLSENYRRYLRAWLFGEDGQEFKERWHSQKRLTEETMIDFQGKARSILCEHYLSARLRANDIGILKVN